MTSINGAPATCRALRCHTYGSWRRLTLETIPEPVPSHDEVLIDVEASGVSFANSLAIAGQHQNRTELPFTPGTELAGVIQRVGDEVHGLSVGDRVTAMAPNGGFASLAAVHETRVFRLPDSMPFDKATSLPTIYATAYASLAIEARTTRADTVLIHGAGGASGLAAVEIAHALGARVVATASNATKRNAAVEAGAELALGTSGFRDTVLSLTDGRGADVVFDPVGGQVFDESLRAVAPEGRVVPVGFASGSIPQIPANLVLVKNISIHGLNWGYYAGWARKPPSARARQVVRQTFDDLFELWEQGKICPRIHATIPMTDFTRAFQAVEDRAVIGKTVLLPKR